MIDLSGRTARLVGANRVAASSPQSQARPSSLATFAHAALPKLWRVEGGGVPRSVDEVGLPHALQSGIRDRHQGSMLQDQSPLGPRLGVKTAMHELLFRATGAFPALAL